MTLPPIVIILLTYQRTEYALRTVRAANAHLRYDGEMRWYVADDGSHGKHVDDVLSTCFDTLQPYGSGLPSSFLGRHSARRGYGGNANDAWRAVDGETPLTFWLEDDWVLESDLDLTPYARLLIERDEIGMVRLGHLNLDVRGRTWGHDGRVYWLLDHAPHHEGTPVFTGHPSLRHRRYRECYGWYPEGRTPGDTELAYAYQFRVGPLEGPGIVWPVGYSQWGQFAHIGEIKSEAL